MRTLEKLKRIGFVELEHDKLKICFGGETGGTTSTTICDNISGCTTTTTKTTTDNADGSKCTTYTTTKQC